MRAGADHSSAQSCSPAATGRGDRYSGANFASRSPVIARNGLAATAQPLATLIAIDMLKRGGTAVDAAIAANAALGLMEPMACGIGGDLFAIVWSPPDRGLFGYNGSGRSPRGQSLAALQSRLGTRKFIPSRGALSVSVPGAIDGWFALHEKFGRLPCREILAPAIAYARAGFPVSQFVAQHWRENMDAFEASNDIEELGNARTTFLLSGAAPREGEMFRNRGLADTYEILAAEGRDAFYAGTIAKKMSAYLERLGAPLGYDDFASHRGEWVEPVSARYRGHDVFELPPNGQGVAALQMLKILEGYDLAGMGAGSADLLHVMIEAKRIAYEDLAKFYADPAFFEAPIKHLISDDYANQGRARIDMQSVNRDVGPGAPAPSAGDTTYLSVADGDGMMVSLIQSNFRGMGSGLVPDGLGFMFQNRGELFSLDPEAANAYAPGKRPFHTIIPGFAMKDGMPFLSFGLMGGDMQPQGHVQVLANIIDFDMNVQEAGDFARFRHFGGSEPTGAPPDGVGWVELESGFSPDVPEELARRGHRLIGASNSFGGYQAIQYDHANRAYWGASEMRKDGAAIGY